MFQPKGEQFAFPDKEPHGNSADTRTIQDAVSKLQQQFDSLITKRAVPAASNKHSSAINEVTTAMRGHKAKQQGHAEQYTNNITKRTHTTTSIKRYTDPAHSQNMGARQKTIEHTAPAAAANLSNGALDA